MGLIENICEILFHHNIRKCVLFKERLFGANLRGVADKKFFLFRIANLYLNSPHSFVLNDRMCTVTPTATPASSN